MKLVLDTNVFSNKKFCNWLLTSKEEKYLPVFAYMEYLNHNLKKGNTESMVDAFLEQMNVSVVPFGKDEAVKAAQGSTGNEDFTANARDYSIGVTATILDAKLVTNDKKRFKWIKNVITPADVLKKAK